MQKRFLVLIGFIIVLSNCTISDIEDPELVNKESCDFSICEDGRDNIDTLSDVHGVLRKKDDLYYVEVTGIGSEPDTLFITCNVDEITFPEIGNYVKFSGTIKESCSAETSSSKDSVYLQQIELINPSEQDNCDKEILNTGYDNDKIDEKLIIHHLSVEDKCLYILVSYVGNCNQIPEITLHNSNDLLFGNGVMINVNLQGEILNDCEVENYAVLKYDISPLADISPYSSYSDITLYFQSQSYLRIEVLL